MRICWSLVCLVSVEGYEFHAQAAALAPHDTDAEASPVGVGNEDNHWQWERLERRGVPQWWEGFVDRKKSEQQGELRTVKARRAAWKALRVAEAGAGAQRAEAAEAEARKAAEAEAEARRAAAAEAEARRAADAEARRAAVA